VRNKAKQSKAKQSKAKQSKAKQSKAKQSKAKQMIVPTVLCGRAVGIFHARNGEREGKPTRRTWSFEASSNRLNAEHLFCLYDPPGDSKCPFRRVNEAVVERGEPQGCGESRKGPWMALVRRPSERRRSERTRSEAQGRMQGQSVFGYFFRAWKK